MRNKILKTNHQTQNRIKLDSEHQNFESFLFFFFNLHF
jgi:hypothetical protein